MKPFFGVQAGELFIATTGYTGEAGYEIALPKAQAADFWQNCWPRASSRPVWARATRCVWKRA